MAVYRRFVAYVYEYPDGKKGNGRGFIKVEARDGVCRMHFRLSGIYSKETVLCSIYGYVRIGERCQGIHLGTCDLAGDLIQFTLEMTENSLGNSEYSLEDLSGIVLLADSGVMYGTGWDEKPVRLEDIVLPQELDPDIESEAKSESKWEPEMESEYETDRRSEMESEYETDRRSEMESEYETDRRPEMESEPKTESGSEMEPEQDKEEPVNFGEEEDVPEMLEVPEMMPQIPSSFFGNVEERERESLNQTVPERVPESDMRAEAVSTGERKSERDIFCPFKDGKYERCIRVTPADFRMLSHRDRGLMNNNFLRYGYRKYGHVLIGKDGEKGGYILGVPGRYDRQEALMAGMFGFPYFKEAQIKEAGTPENRSFPRSGYWYRSIDSPHIDGRDGF